MYFDDLPVGFSFETASRSLPLDEILEFANKWDPQPFHTDAEQAKDSIYGGLIASGFHTILVAFLLTLETNVFTEASMGSPGMDKIRWYLPVRPGDTIRLKGTVLTSAISKSRPERGRTTFRYEVFNQNDERVAEYSAIQLLRCKPQIE